MEIYRRSLSGLPSSIDIMFHEWKHLLWYPCLVDEVHINTQRHEEFHWSLINQQSLINTKS